MIATDAKIRILEEALEFYADTDNWKRKKGRVNKFGNRSWVKSSANFDKGSRARFVLATLKESEK